MGIHALDAGINLIPALIGIYAVGELINASKSFDKKIKMETNYKIKGFGFTWKEFKEQIEKDVAEFKQQVSSSVYTMSDLVEKLYQK